ncbi:MAG: hypothetical protein LKI40_00045 [Olsenella sp.]|nr:hypothetical protein [Olsenella sp.]MCI1644595.1 hypothetical protein [Olsenella sp.]MCI1879585.1 hypothetical protein [Olsenella sp.]
MRVGLHLATVRLDGLRHRLGRYEPAWDAHVVGRGEQRRRHAAGLARHDRRPPGFQDAGGGAADLPLALPCPLVERDLARSPADRGEVVRPLSNVDAAADVGFTFRPAPSGHEELALCHGAGHGITLGEQAAPKRASTSTHRLSAGASEPGGMAKKTIGTAARGQTGTVGHQRRTILLPLRPMKPL